MVGEKSWGIWGPRSNGRIMAHVTLTFNNACNPMIVPYRIFSTVQAVGTDSRDACAFFIVY
jgi:hypothetical protein